MPWRTLSAGLLWSALMVPVRADDAAGPPAEAVAAFTEGKQLLAAGKDARQPFRKAAELLASTLSGRSLSAGRAVNCGNACFLAGDLAGAIAAFRLALMLDPHQATARQNLAYARLQVPYPQEGRDRPELDFWPGWMPRWRSGAWLLVAVGGYVLGWFVLLKCWRRPRPTFAVLGVSLMALAGVAAYGWSLLDDDFQRNQDSPVVVLAEDQALFHIGNGPSYPLHPELPRLRLGMEARQLTRRGDWLQIRFASGEVGWVEARKVRVAALACR